MVKIYDITSRKSADQEHISFGRDTLRLDRNGRGRKKVFRRGKTF